MHNSKIVFAGTPEFAIPSLQALIESPHEVVAVYTQPDRPAGRGRKLTSSPVKQLALKHDLPVQQPLHFKDEVNRVTLKQYKPDVMIVVAYGLLLPPAVLAIPTFACINVHASLLPRWRGAAPIQRAILAGDKKSGVSLMQMEAGLDTGPVYCQRACVIQLQDTSQDLHDRLARLGAETLIQNLSKIMCKELKPQHQNESQATYAKKIHKQEANIDWQQSAEKISRMVRAFNPWPIAFTHCYGARLRIWQAEVIELAQLVAPGTVCEIARNGIDVATGAGGLRITRLQFPGTKVLTPLDVINAHSTKIAVGMRFK